MFFAAHSPALGLLNIVPQLALILATIVVFLRLDRVAAWCLVPLAVWVAFATILNLAILAAKSVIHGTAEAAASLSHSRTLRERLMGSRALRRTAVRFQSLRSPPIPSVMLHRKPFSCEARDERASSRLRDGKIAILACYLGAEMEAARKAAGNAKIAIIAGYILPDAGMRLEGKGERFAVDSLQMTSKNSKRGRTPPVR